MEATEVVKVNTTEVNCIPHHSTFTKCGQHFKRVSDGIAEFFDNSIQASSGKPDAAIHLSLYLSNGNKGYAAIFDNGKGMNVTSLTHFATHSLNYESRRLLQQQEDGASIASQYEEVLFDDPVLSKFGVGAKQAGFFLGDRIRVITKEEDSAVVKELIIDEKTLDERFKEKGNSEDLYKLIIKERPHRSAEAAIPEDEKSFSPSLLSDFREHEEKHSSFTTIVLRLKTSIVRRLLADRKYDSLPCELAEIYHFYMHPEDLPHALAKRGGRFNADNKSSSSSSSYSVRPQRFRGDDDIKLSPVALSYSTVLNHVRSSRLKLSEGVNMMQQYIANAAAMIRFTMQIPDPGAVDQGGDEEEAQEEFRSRSQKNVARNLHTDSNFGLAHSSTHTVRGMVFYYPCKEGRETRPSCTTRYFREREAERPLGSFLHLDNMKIIDLSADSDDEAVSAQSTTSKNITPPVFEIFDNDDEWEVYEAGAGENGNVEDLGKEKDALCKVVDDGIFNVFWSRRLVTETTVKELPFFPKAKTATQCEKIGLPEKWRRRLKGCVFLDWNFKHISNNKLKIQVAPNFDEWLNGEVAKQLIYSPSSLRDNFFNWLKECNRLFDKEFELDQRDLKLEQETQSSTSIFKRLTVEKSYHLDSASKPIRLNIPGKGRKVEQIFARIVYFEVDKKLAADVKKYHGVGKIRYIREPTRLYGGNPAPLGLPFSAIVKADGKPVEVSASEISKLAKKGPNKIKLFFCLEKGGKIEPVEKNCSIPVGRELYKIAAQILNADGDPIAALPHTSERLSVSFKAVIGETPKDFGTTNELYEYDSVKGEDVKCAISKAKCSADAYYAAYRPTFLEAGRGELIAEVKDGDRVVMDLKVEVKFDAVSVDKVNIVGDFTSHIRLGDAFPPFAIEFKDAFDNPVSIAGNNIIVELTSSRMTASFHLGGGRENQAAIKIASDDHRGMIKFKADAWRFVPANDDDLDSFAKGKKNTITVNVYYSSSPSSAAKSRSSLGLLSKGQKEGLRVGPAASFPCNFIPGLPVKLDVLNPKLPDRLTNGDTVSKISFVCLDEWDNVTCPTSDDTQWRLVLDEIGPLKCSNEAYFRSDGRGSLVGIQVEADSSLPICGGMFNQAVYLDMCQEETIGSQNSSKIQSSRCMFLEQIGAPFHTLTFSVYPNGVPKSAKLKINGHAISPEVERSERPRTVLQNITFALYDEDGRELDFEPSLFSKVTSGYQADWVGETSTFTRVVSNRLPDIMLPEVSGTCEKTLLLRLDGIKEVFTASVCIVVLPSEPVQWKIIQGPYWQDGVMCGESVDLCEKILGVCLADEYGNAIEVDENVHPTPELFSRSATASISDLMDEVDDEEHNSDDNETADKNFENDEEAEDAAVEALAIARRKRAFGKFGGSSRFSSSTSAKKLKVAPMTDAISIPLVPGYMTLSVGNLTIPLQGVDPTRTDFSCFVIKVGSTVVATALPTFIDLIVPAIGSIRSSTFSGVKIIPGLPRKIALSSEAHNLAVTSGTADLIHVSRFQKLSDLVVHFLDAYGNHVIPKDTRKFSFHITDSSNQVLSKKMRFSKSSSITAPSISFNIDHDRESLCVASASAGGAPGVQITLTCQGTCESSNSAKSGWQLEPAVLPCLVTLLNVVTQLDIHYMYEGRPIASTGSESAVELSAPCDAASPVPKLSIHFIMDDGVPFLPDPLDLKIKIVRKCSNSGETQRIDCSDVFESRVVNEAQGCVDFIPWRRESAPDVMRLDNSDFVGSYTFSLLYEEKRDAFQCLPESEKKISTSCVFNVSPGSARGLRSQPLLENLVASNSAVESRRVIASGVKIFAIDGYGNNCAIPDDCTIVCTLEATNEDDESRDVSLPLLEGGDQTEYVQGEVSNNRAYALFRRILIQAETGRGVSTVALKFALMSGSGSLTPDIDLRLAVSFTTDVAVAEQAAEIKRSLVPLQEEIRQYRKELTDVECALSRVKHNIRRALDCVSRENLGSFREDELTQATLDQRMVALRRQLRDMEQSAPARPSRKPDGAPNVAQLVNRHGIDAVDLVVDLGFVDDRHEANILSWAAKYYLDTIVTESDSGAIALRDLRYKSWSKEQMFPYLLPDKNSQRRRPRNEEERLTGQLPLEPSLEGIPGNPKYLVNIIQLPQSNEHLRDSIFFNIYRNHLLMDDTTAASEYRKHLKKKSPQPPPVIFTRDGYKIGSEGVLDPNEGSGKLPSRLHFVFGQIPPNSSADFRAIQEDLSFADEIKKDMEERDRLQELREQLESEVCVARIRSLEASEAMLEAQLQSLGVASNANALVNKRVAKRHR